MLCQRDSAHRAIAHAFAALDTFVHVRGWRSKTNLLQRVYRTNPNGRTRVVFGATAAAYANDCIGSDGLFLLWFAAKHLAPNTVTQVNTSIKIYYFYNRAFCAC
jgi:hypothetical protein